MDRENFKAQSNSAKYISCYAPGCLRVISGVGAHYDVMSRKRLVMVSLQLFHE